MVKGCRHPGREDRSADGGIHADRWTGCGGCELNKCGVHIHCGSGLFTVDVSGGRNLETIGKKITLYNKAGGKVLSGLIKRRAEEQALYNTPVSGQTTLQVAEATQTIKTHSVGETVTYSSCYKASTDPTSKAIDVNPWKTGTITKIKEGARNPYLIGNGTCWVNDGDIRGAGAVKQTPDRHFHNVHCEIRRYTKWDCQEVRNDCDKAAESEWNQKCQQDLRGAED